jgi:RNA polymerase sigma-70 factor, ECF subfamily
MRVMPGNAEAARDLALAHACSEGREDAWEFFLKTYRDKLYSAALAIARDEAIAYELVDGLIGDLYRSKMASYTGRGSLGAWLKATLAQAYVDRYRLQRRLVSLDDGLACLKQLCVEESNWEAVDPRLETAIEDSLAGLAPEARFILKAYFFDECTLAQIGTMLGVHESTVSRRIGKLTKELRREVLRKLKKQGMSSKAAQEALVIDIRCLSIDVRRQLLGSAQPVRD